MRWYTALHPGLELELLAPIPVHDEACLPGGPQGVQQRLGLLAFALFFANPHMSYCRNSLHKA